MSVFSPTIDVEQPRIGGRGPDVPRRHGGDGNGGEGDGEDYLSRLRRARIAVFMLLVPIVMLFVAFSSAYVVRQGIGVWDDATKQYVRDWQPLTLPVFALVMNTVLLVASSVTLEFARRSLKFRMAAERADVPATHPVLSLPWVEISVLLGAAFVAGQLLVWRDLRAHGVYLATNPSSSFFYLLTGAHGVHLLGGMVALSYAMFATLAARPLIKRRLVVDVTAMYWHFMAFLWIYIFGLMLYLK